MSPSPTARILGIISAVLLVLGDSLSAEYGLERGTSANSFLFEGGAGATGWRSARAPTWC